jgi:hypothetical protein
MCDVGRRRSRRGWALTANSIPAYFSMAQHFGYQKLGNGDMRLGIEIFRCSLFINGIGLIAALLYIA